MTKESLIQQALQYAATLSRHNLLSEFERFDQVDGVLFRERKTGKLWYFLPELQKFEAVSTEQTISILTEMLYKFHNKDRYRRAVEDFLNANPPRE